MLKAWAKREKRKTDKFYEIVNNYQEQNRLNEIIILKIQILLHNYLKKGPCEAIFVKYERKKSALSILENIQSTWEKQNSLYI